MFCSSPYGRCGSGLYLKFKYVRLLYYYFVKLKFCMVGGLERKFDPKGRGRLLA